MHFKLSSPIDPMANPHVQTYAIRKILLLGAGLLEGTAFRPGKTICFQSNGLNSLSATMTLERDEVIPSTPPQSRRALIRYLKEHPQLRMDHPGGVPAIPLPTSFLRAFLKVESSLIVFASEQQGECQIHAPAELIRFYPDRFEIFVDETLSKSVVYFYLED